MAINAASGNKIELASGNQLTTANILAMKQNLLDGGSNGKNIFWLVDPEYLTNIMNVLDNGEKIFLRNSDYPKGTLASGVLGTILGFQVLLSHNLPTLNDAGDAYDASGEKAMVYYDADAYAYGSDMNPSVEFDRDIDNIPIRNKVLVWKYTGNALVDANKCGHVREYSAP